MLPDAASLAQPSEPGNGGERAALIHELRLELLRLGGRCRGRLESGSMAPTIAVGDEVVVAPLTSRLRPGDVVLFERDGTPTVHRLIRAASAPRCWIEKGDANPSGGVVSEEAVAGRVVAVEKPAGSIDLTSFRSRCAGRVIAALAGLAIPRRLDGHARRGRLARAALRAASRAADVLVRGAARPGGTR